MLDTFLDLKNTKARAISLGENQMSEYQFGSLPLYISVIIYSYKNGNYEGYGVAFCKNDKQLWTYISLSHCSCHGPLDMEFWDKKVFKSLEETWKSITDKSEQNISVYEKAKEFIN